MRKAASTPIRLTNSHSNCDWSSFVICLFSFQAKRPAIEPPDETCCENALGRTLGNASDSCRRRGFFAPLHTRPGTCQKRSLGRNCNSRRSFAAHEERRFRLARPLSLSAATRIAKPDHGCPRMRASGEDSSARVARRSLQFAGTGTQSISTRRRAGSAHPGRASLARKPRYSAACVRTATLTVDPVGNAGATQAGYAR